MKYNGRVLGKDVELSVEQEGLRLGPRFVDYSEFASLSPINHRVIIDTLSNEKIEISMLGFSFDGFWKEIVDSYNARCLQSLFIDEALVMSCEANYVLPEEAGRGVVSLYTDCVCILPPSFRAVRLPLCYADRIDLNGYDLSITMRSGTVYTVGKMGYDTKPFTERCVNNSNVVKKQRAAAAASLPLNPPFVSKGLFRTKQPELFWNAAFGKGTCALELFTGDDAATYLYRFKEPNEVFLARLEEAMEAIGVNRELIYLSDERIAEKPLYQMSIARSEAVRFLRARSDGRLIHNANHAQRLAEYLNS